jgi:excisionase family DNA binding protein
MEALSLFPYDESALKTLIYDVVRIALSNHEANNKTQEPEYLTINELREYLPQKPAKQTIYQWVHFKQVPYHKRGKSVLFKRSEIDTWISQTRRTTLEEAERILTNR